MWNAAMMQMRIPDYKRTYIITTVYKLCLEWKGGLIPYFLTYIGRLSEKPPDKQIYLEKKGSKWEEGGEEEEQETQMFK